jgi:hypothetical protein
VSRSYVDGHISEMRIHHDGGVSKIPIDALEDGDRVARIILAMFARMDRARTRNRRLANAPAESRQRDIRVSNPRESGLNEIGGEIEQAQHAQARHSSGQHGT